MFFTKCACHATSIMKRTFKREFSLAPQNVSTTNNLFPESCLVVRSFKSFHTSGVVGLLSFGDPGVFHQIVSLVTSSSTINLSLGERPVNSPVITFTAPSSVS